MSSKTGVSSLGSPDMLTGLSGANTAASTSPLLIPPRPARDRETGPGKGEKGEERGRNKGGEGKKPLRRGGASCAGGRPGRLYLAAGRLYLAAGGGSGPGSGRWCGANQAPGAGPAGTPLIKGREEPRQRARAAAHPKHSPRALPPAALRQELRKIPHTGIQSRSQP